MTDRPVDFEDDDIDMGEPVTDKLNVLLDELYDEWGGASEEVDLGEPVTDKLNNLLSALPDDWTGEELEPDLTGPVTDRITAMLHETPPEDAQPPRGLAARLGEFARNLFGRGKS